MKNEKEEVKKPITNINSSLEILANNKITNDLSILSAGKIINNTILRSYSTNTDLIINNRNLSMNNIATDFFINNSKGSNIYSITNNNCDLITGRNNSMIVTDNNYKKYKLNEIKTYENDNLQFNEIFSRTINLSNIQYDDDTTLSKSVLFKINKQNIILSKSENNISMNDRLNSSTISSSFVFTNNLSAHQNVVSLNNLVDESNSYFMKPLNELSKNQFLNKLSDDIM